MVKHLSNMCKSMGLVYTITKTKTKGKPDKYNDYVCVRVLLFLLLYQVSEASN